MSSGSEKRDAKFAFVGGHRRRRGAHDRAKRRPRNAPTESEPAAGREPSELATDARSFARHLWFDPLRPLPGTMYRTIPLNVDGERGIAGRGPSPSDAAQHQAAVRAPSRTQTRHAAAASLAGVQPPACEDPIETLDHVIHDIVGSPDQSTSAEDPDSAGCTGGTSAAHNERFLRLLGHVPLTKGLVLGPPVLLGASPAVGLESMLGLLGSLRKTGILRVEADGATFTVSIVNGDVVHGVSDPRPQPELLGYILVALGKITSQQLGRFVEEWGSSAATISEALDRQVLVSTDQLREALEHQLQLLFDRLLATRESVWCFHEGEASLNYINMRMNVIRVLLESARKHDERPAW